MEFRLIVQLITDHRVKSKGRPCYAGTPVYCVTYFRIYFLDKQNFKTSHSFGKLELK